MGDIPRGSSLTAMPWDDKRLAVPTKNIQLSSFPPSCILFHSYNMLQSLVVALTALAASASATVYGVDSSSLVPEGTYAIAKSEGFTKVVIRGYEEACGSGGEVDPNFVDSYNNARAAGTFTMLIPTRNWRLTL